MSRSPDCTLTIEHAISLDGSKAKKVLGFKPTKPKVEVEELIKIVKEYQDDGIWQVPFHSSEMVADDLGLFSI